jgi:DNA-binding CsgD family transcriptional regulator
LAERAVPDRPASSRSSSQSLSWPLIGRERELERIAQARAESDCRGVVISARAGIGKSRLAREACAAAERDGALVDWIQATSSAATVPLGALAGLLPDDVRTDDVLELMRRSVDVLLERAAGRPVVLGVDDAQLLDPVSATLVLHLASTASAFVIATVRIGEPRPDAIVSLWKDAGAHRLELERLSDEDVDALVEAALAGPVGQYALRWVRENSQGNALYVRELVIGAVEDGTLAYSRGLWRLSGRPAVSQPLAELVSQRMAGLSDVVRAPLELLAIGEPLRLQELTTLTESESLMAAEANGMAEVVTRASGDEMRLTHPLYGEVIRRELPVLRARELRLRLAATLQERDPLLPDDALRVARWLLDAEASVPLPLLMDGARAARLSGDPELAVELSELGIAAGGGEQATLLLARACAAREQYAEAEAILATLEGKIATQDTASEYLEHRAVAVLYWGLKRPKDAQELLLRAQDWWPEQAWQRRLDPIRLLLASLVGGFAATVDVSGQILEDPDLDQAVRHQMEPVHAVSLFYTGQARAGYALARKIRPSVPLLDESATLALGVWTIVGVETGENWEDFESYMTQTVSDGVRANDRVAAGISANALASTLFLKGRYRDMARWLAESEMRLERNDALGTLVIVRALQVGLAVFTGEHSDAAVALERLHTALDGHDPLPSQLPYTARAEGWAARARGDLDGARELLLATADSLTEMPGYASQLTYEAMRAGAPAASMVAKQKLLIERCDSRLVAAYAAHTVALAAKNAKGLMAVAEEMATIGALRYAMEAAVDASSAFLQEGRKDSARRAAARARELFEPNQGGTFPVIDGLDSAAIALTPRETQLVELASQGLSNAEIADRLVLSTRTVESHIYRAMGKLGVSDRRDL